MLWLEQHLNNYYLKATNPLERIFLYFFIQKQKEEYALARTERKSGIGYHGSSFLLIPLLKLEDLIRRDLTINAMAMDEDWTSL